MFINPNQSELGPLHPLTFTLANQIPGAAVLLEGLFEQQVSGATPPPLSAVPLIASELLELEIDRRVKELCLMLKRPLRLRSRDASAAPIDTLSLDLAIVQAPELERGWDLRWVEFQSFTSVPASTWVIAEAHRDLWPELVRLRFHDAVPGGATWVEHMKSWMAPESDSVLLEDTPKEQYTYFDMVAAAKLWNLPIVEPGDLRAESGKLQRKVEDGNWAPVSHVLNRVIRHKSKTPSVLSSLLKNAKASWHSHPDGYYVVNKGLLPQLPLAPNEKAALARDWKTLNLPPERLVLKAIESCAGADVHLAVTEQLLNNLDNPEGWIVQPKYAPLPLVQTDGGQNLFGEIRCMVYLREGREPWTGSRVIRVYAGPKASLSAAGHGPGPGLSLLYHAR